MIVQPIPYPASGIGSTPTFVEIGARSLAGDGDTGVSPAYPASLANNDILFLDVFTTLNRTITVPGDWTQIFHVSNTQTGITSALYWKRANGSESGTVPCTFSSALSLLGAGWGAISAWRGCVTSGVPFERAAYHDQINTASHRGKAIATTGPNRLVVAFEYWNSGNTGSNNDANWTEIYENTANPSGNSAGKAVSTYSQAAAGKVSGNVRAMGGTADHAYMAVALVPAGETAGAADPFAQVLLQIQASGANGSTTFTDESHFEHPITPAGNAQVQSNKIELDGTGDWLVLPVALRRLFRFLTEDQTANSDFTIDAWGVQFDSLAGENPIFSSYDAFANATDNRSFIWGTIAATGNCRVTASTGGTSGTTTNPINAASTLTAGGGPYDLRLVRSVSAGEFYFYVNGTKVLTGTWAGSNTLFATTSPPCIGGFNTRADISGNRESADGRMSAIRITRSALSTGPSYAVESLPLATS